MKKNPGLKIFWHYLKDDKLKFILYVILVLLTYAPAIISAYFWGKALEFLIAKNLYEFGFYLFLWIAIAILCYVVFNFFQKKIYNELEIKFMRNVTVDLYKKIDDLPARSFEEMGVGEFINRLYSDPDLIMSLVSNLVSLMCNGIVVVIVFIICFKISIFVGMEMIIFSLVMWLISFKFFPKIKKVQEEIKKESDNYVKMATENITGIREIKSLGIKKNTEKNIFKTINTMFKKQKKSRNYEVWYDSFIGFMYFSLEFVIFLTVGYYFVKGKIVYALFIALQTCIWQVDSFAENISQFGVNYNKVIVSLNRIDEIINNKLYDDEKFGNVVLNNCQGNIEFKNVTFKYSKEEDLTLNNFNLKIVPHKKVAIVGRSGNGKTTIFNLLLRYFDVTDGQILIDGIDIRDLTEDSLRKNISIIRQAPFLFNLSVFDNFKLIKENVTLDEVREVCQKAYIDDYIMSLPKKYDTIIGEGGINLSGGQKQRMAIARTLLLNTKIILFDEATSALDNESQSYIKQTIDNLVKDHTVVIIAHRLSTIIDADIINVVSKGQLVAFGTHKELLESSDIYKNLYENEASNSN